MVGICYTINEILHPQTVSFIYINKSSKHYHVQDKRYFTQDKTKKSSVTNDKGYTGCTTGYNKVMMYSKYDMKVKGLNDIWRRISVVSIISGNQDDIDFAVLTKKNICKNIHVYAF